MKHYSPAALMIALFFVSGTKLSGEQRSLIPRYVAPKEFSHQIAEKENSPRRERVQVGDEIVDKERCVYPYEFNKGPQDDKKLLKAYGAPEVKNPYRFKNHLYVRYETRLEPPKWVPDFVNEDGVFSSDQYLAPNSVVPGEWVGMPGKKFKFLADKPRFEAWVETKEEVKVVWRIKLGMKWVDAPEENVPKD